MNSDVTRNSESGLTLLEVIVAMAILAFGIIGVLQVFSSGMRSCKRAEEYSVASGLAQRVVSELERSPGLQAGQFSGTFAGDTDGYTWTADLQQAVKTGLFLARVTVMWGSESRRSQMQFTTVIKESKAVETTAAAPEGST